MKISYCTVCTNRLWQLKITLPINIEYTKKGESEIIVLAYNDIATYAWLQLNYPEHIADGRLRIIYHLDVEPFSCGYTKHIVHSLAEGDVLVNLDADNFIDNLEKYALEIKPNQIVKTYPSLCDIGQCGRIIVTRELYHLVGGYRDMGRDDDGDFTRRCMALPGVEIKQIYTYIHTIPNCPTRIKPEVIERNKSRLEFPILNAKETELENWRLARLNRAVAKIKAKNAK